MTHGGRELSAGERRDWLRLIRSENVGPITFRQLLKRYETAGEALVALPELARRGGRKRPIKVASLQETDKEIEQLQSIGAELIGFCEPAYPNPLAALNDAPPLLSVRGHKVLLEKPTVAMVGARNAPANALKLTEEIARDLGKAGLIVASGLARGIDGAAHRGALQSGTVAVVAGGVDQIYPPENEQLYHAIAEQGLILSEMPFGTVAQARHFPRRNRLVSGISYGVLIVQAALKSGSLITARFALEQGREIFAVPGFPSDPRCRGSNKLLKDGANLTENAQDILSALNPMLETPFHEPDAGLFAAPFAIADEDVDHARQTVHDLLSPSPTSVDDLIRLSAIPPAIIHTILLELELAGRLQRHAGQRVSLT